MKNFVINKYLVFEFLKSLMNVILVFACLGLIMNLFEEINILKLWSWYRTTNIFIFHDYT
jgi:hypothetical protein